MTDTPDDGTVTITKRETPDGAEVVMIRADHDGGLLNQKWLIGDAAKRAWQIICSAFTNGNGADHG